MSNIEISETDLLRLLNDREHILRQIKELQERGSRFVLENRRLKQQLIVNNIEVPVDFDITWREIDEDVCSFVDPSKGIMAKIDGTDAHLEIFNPQMPEVEFVDLNIRYHSDSEDGKNSIEMFIHLILNILKERGSKNDK